MLKNIRVAETEQQVASHIWLNKVQGFWDIEDNLKEGVEIEFFGRVDSYEKGWAGKKAEEYGYGNTESDWKISRPTKISIVK